MTNNLKFECNAGTAKAIGVIVHKFKVLKGARVQDVKSSLNNHASGYCAKRKELEDKRIIQNGQFAVDYEFDSPSEATCVILGTSCANFSNWKLCGGQSLHDIWDNPKRTRGKSKKAR